MSSTLFADDALSAASLALRGLTERQQVISSNITNDDTPGYNAREYDFETTLKRTINSVSGSVSIKRSDSRHIAAKTSTNTNLIATSNREGGTYREDGNNVDISTELIDMSETNIKYQAISQGLSNKLLLLKSIAQGG